MKTRFHVFFKVLLSCNILFSGLATSQDANTSLIKGLSLEDLFNIEITIASKTEETIADAPSSVTVFARAEIESMGIFNLRDLLNFVPGFQSTMVNSDGQYHAVQPRGRKTSAGISPDVLFLIDGQRLNDSHSGGASTFSRLLSLGYVKQVEIIRGPGSALYGSNAFLGVVNVVTESQSNEAYLKGGENGQIEGRASFSKTLGDWNISLYMGAFSDDGHDYHFDAETSILQDDIVTTDPREGGDAYLSMEYKRLTIKARYQERSFDNFFNFNFAPTDININKSWESSANVSYKIVDNDRFKLKGRLEYMRHRWRAYTEIVPVFDPPFRAGPYYWNTDAIASLDMDYQFTDNQQFIAGLFYRNTENENLKALTNYTPFGSFENSHDGPVVADNAVPGEEDRQVWGAYLQDKITINDQFTLFVGARFDNYSDFGSTFNPRGGAIYSTPFNSKIKALYGSAFRAPSLTEIYNESPTRESNPDLGPEEVETIELVYIQDFGTRARLAVTLFQSDISNEIVGVAVGDEQKTKFENDGRTESTGGEFELSWALTDSILLKGTFTTIFDYKQVRPNQQAQPLRDSYDNYGSIILNYRGVNWSANINGIFRDKIESFSGQDSYFLANAKVAYRISSYLTIDVTAENVFDEQYSTYADDFLILGGAVPNRGRQASLGLKFQF